ncbi:MAG TPA: bifunctional YncE family protein/alkaline phosphatase family protein [Terriglobales bacterium]|nr:bifunctional YncE family protein/alkaline phosphatase family protein [Terriglobales bacterium]
MHKPSLLGLACLASVLACFASAAVTLANATSTPVVLPTGATITPDAAPGAVFGPLLVNLPDYPNHPVDGAQTTAISPDGKTLLILTSGFNKLRDGNGVVQPQDSSEYVFVYDISSPSLPVQSQVVLVANAFGGIVWSPDGTKFYVAGGKDDNLHSFAKDASGVWGEVGTPLALGHKGNLMNQETQTAPTAAGLGITADGGTVIVANWETDSITAVDVVHNVVAAEYDLRPGIINPAQTGVPGGEFPFGVVVKGNNTVYVSSARDREIDVLNLAGSVLNLTTRIPVAGNPAKMMLNAAQTKLLAVVDNADALVIIDTAANAIIGQVNTSAPLGVLGTGKIMPKGSNPNSVTLSPDEKTAYVTNGGTNAVAVISLSGKLPVVTGLIPTGWQPNSVSVSPDGGTMYVVNGKSNTGANPLNCRFINAGGNYGSACQNVSAQNGSGNQYAWANMQAGLLVLPVPSATDLSSLTGIVAENNGFNLQLSAQDISTMLFLRQHIQHVVYIVKENRTYDQILGDLPVGNGDPTLTQFPQAVTPNFHALASNFVDFDNFYDTGNGSMDGWQWSTAARALDLEEKSQVINYGKGGSAYDSEGTDRNVNTGLSTVAERKAWQPLYPNDPNLLPGTANEVAADGPNGQKGLGYIWDAAIRKGLRVRNYGFFLDLGRGFQIDLNIVDPCSTKPPTQVAFPADASLVKKTDLCFRGYDNAFTDFFRYKEWAREFNKQVKSNTFPALSLVRFSHDHFGSFGIATYGVNTPELQMADNDYATALLIDKIAHSPYASNTLIFVIEDDPQDGADHVSANRSLAFIVGPYVRHGAVVSTHYATPNMLRTMEEVLGIGNLGVHDAGVPPMTDAFDTTQASWTFNAFPALVLFNTQLPLLNKSVVNLAAIPKPTHEAAWWEERTKGFDFSQEDRVPTELFNRVIWQGLKGDIPYPTVRSGADLRQHREQLLKTALPQPEHNQAMSVGGQ